MSRIERIVELYLQRYQMNLHEFMRFLHEKVDSPLSVLSTVEQYILKQRMSITEDDIRHFLHIVAAAQEGVDLSKMSPQQIVSFEKVKFVRKTRVVDFDQIQVSKIKVFGENASRHQKKDYKQENVHSSTKHEESFEVLNEGAEEYQISLESSLYQNETSVELLCEDNLMHLFQGNVLHAFRDLKRNLVQSIQQLAEKEILSTKFISSYNSNKFIPGSLCLLARTAKNIPFGIFALENIEQKQIKGQIKGCLVSLHSGRNVRYAVKRKNESQNCLELLMQNMGIICMIRQKEGVRLNFSKKAENLTEIRQILQVDESSWGVSIDSIQCFQIQLK